MAKKVIYQKHNVLDEILELAPETYITPAPANFTSTQVDKKELTTPIGAERLHATRPWNKNRPKVVGGQNYGRKKGAKTNI